MLPAAHTSYIRNIIYILNNPKNNGKWNMLALATINSPPLSVPIQAFPIPNI